MYIDINYTLYPWKQQVQVPPGAQVTGAYEWVLGTEPVILLWSSIFFQTYLPFEEIRL